MKIHFLPEAVITFIIIAQSKLNATENYSHAQSHNYNSCKPNTINWCQPHTCNAVNCRSTNSIDVILLVMNAMRLYYSPIPCYFEQTL